MTDKAKPSAHDLEYWTERLAEPELLERAVLLEVDANEAVPLAVPVGKLRKGGHIEFVRKREAEKASRLLQGNEGFPNLRVITCRDPLTGRPMRYYELRWGEPPRFGVCDWSDPICALLLGVHYGYRNDAIAELVERYQKHRRVFSRREILKIIESARHKP